MTKKRKRRLRLKNPFQQRTTASSSQEPRKRRRRRKLKLRREAWLAIAGVVAILCLIFIPRAVDNSNLKKLGYDKEAIAGIRKQKLTKTILGNEWYSSYLSQSIKDGTLNKDYTELYTVVTAQRGLTDNDFLLYNRLLDKGYTADQLLNLYHNLRYIDLTPLLVFDLQTDESAYIIDCQANMSTNDADNFSLDGTYYTPYAETRPVDDSTNVNMLVNKTYYLDESYVPEKLTELSNYYAAADRDLAGVAADALANWCNAGRDNDVYFYATSAYRPYSAQEELYEGYIKAVGQEQADLYSAKAGHSEHQTGLAVDLAATHEDAYNDFSETRAYKWATAHCWEYGWILRYPTGKRDITGYDYESWHYRYVGTQVSRAVHETGLTYDEFYCLYLKPWDNEKNMPSQAVLDATDYTKLAPEEPEPAEAAESSAAPETPAEPEASAEPEATATPES